MNTAIVTKPEIKLLGMMVRTNNKNEMNPAVAKIGDLIGKYYSQNIAAQMSNRKNPGVTFSVYTEYESDENGDYTYFVGEEVNSFDSIPEGMKKLIIPASKYARLTTSSGKMPEVVINAWQKIWKMTEDDFGGSRTYIADFEVYDQRASDPSNTILDIYIGIK